MIQFKFFNNHLIPQCIWISFIRLFKLQDKQNMFTLTRGVHPQPWRMDCPDRCWPVRLCTTRLVWSPRWFYCLFDRSTGFLPPNQQPDWLVHCSMTSCEWPVNQTIHTCTLNIIKICFIFSTRPKAGGDVCFSSQGWDKTNITCRNGLCFQYVFFFSS